MHRKGASDFFAIIWNIPKFFLSLQMNNNKNAKRMEATAKFTHEQWVRHEKFVEMIHAAKQRKEAWVKKMQAQWAEEDLMRKEAEAKHYYDIEGE